MNVRIRTEWVTGTDRHEVYVFTPTIDGGTAVAHVAEDGALVFTTYKAGEKCPPTFVVPGMFIGALRDELNKLGPFSDSPVDWLRDTLVQRDRLMTIVEKLVP